ncbi:hypothetical protein JY651_43530 [Pyxidicoccus parkwayensis]|uniref:Uncharacterized protein n=1 Tax=Pyxidicoccus parkwayensis TaxID=2813578 RepID=A0ABX7NX32_9BACT|nr:hypothetical protein [Pyxidicoccus parkwaysis]QSQ21946.1 hypothetical protein JY651_43530 [Pyxidicoccus parkwaysis]
MATDRAERLVELGSRADSAIGWASSDVHPMQSLETVAQRVVRAAGAQAPDPAARMQAEFDALNRFYVFDAWEPELLRENEEAPKDTSPVARFDAARRQLEALRGEVSHPPAPALVTPQYVERLRERLRAALLELNEVRLSFYAYAETRNVQVPILQRVEFLIAACLQGGVDAAVAPAHFVNLFHNQVDELLAELTRAVEGLAKVQMLYSIDSFYLFRLLVPFRVVSDLGVSRDDRTRVSSELTGLLNNGPDMAWVSTWLWSKMVELADGLQAMDPNQENVIFYLKGGRAQAYLLDVPHTGENDWDTSIVINPGLPAEYWYATFNQVHNFVLGKLRQFKQEFFMLVTANANDVAIAMAGKPLAHPLNYPEALEEVANLFTDPEDPGQQGSCKAELIDIGIPRRDSVEAIEQWNHTGPDLLHYNDVPIPGHRYYFDEYVAMVREAFAGRSPSPQKASKRLRRLYDVVSQASTDLDAVVARARLGLDGLLPLALSVVDQPHQPPYVSRTLVLMLEQFAEAYSLWSDPGLAALFDNRFYFDFQNEYGRIPYPDPVDQGLEKDIRAGAFDLNTHGQLLQWLLLFEKLSNLFEGHFADRAAFFGFGQAQPPTAAEAGRRRQLEEFIRALYTGFGLTQEQELEVQFAIGGACAAWLHADYTGMAPAQKRALDPVRFIELKLACRRSNVNPALVRDALIGPVLQAYVANPANPPFAVQLGEDGAFEVFWPAEENLGHFAYHPLVLRITVDREWWPELAFIWGLPVLSLKDLVREYVHEAGMTTEWGRREELKQTLMILREQLTRFE